MIDVIANRYAEALFQIGEEENKTDNLYNELKEVSSLITTNNDLNNVMKSPLVSKNEKIQLIDTLFAGKIDNDLKNFFKILVEKGRITSVEAIEATYKELLNEKNNILEGYVISAIALTEKQVKELEEKLSKKYNKNVTLENEVDQSILGGVLVRLGNTQIDGSVKTRLNNIKDQLTQVIS